MRLGVAYYPELRPPQEWAADFEKIRAAGLARIRVGEFAWSRMEPVAGAYAWDWLDESLALAGEYGLEVVLCTPTACPPIWLVELHPEVLPVDVEGQRTLFGARQHRCYNTPAYQEHSERIARALAERYGQHPQVVAWQLDNEFGGEQKRCYCEHCHRAFHRYLEDKYGTVAALNERWGNAFWSQEYQRWEQIPVPMRHTADLQMRHHPSLELEFTQFSSDSIVAFSRHQATLIREHSDRPITTNAFMFRWGDNLNWYDLFAELDAAGIDIYSQAPYENAFYAGLCRGIKPEAVWVMEYGSRTPRIREALDLLEAHGCDWLYFFKFNPTAGGQEQSMAHLLTLAGTPTANYHAVQAWDASETTAAEAEIAMRYDFPSSWIYAIEHARQPLEERLRYPRYLIHTVYCALFEAYLAGQEGAVARLPFLSPGTPIPAQCRLFVLPWQICYDAQLEAQLIDFVKGGGRLITTVDLFHKDDANVYLTQVPEIYRALLDWHEEPFIEPGDEVVVRVARAGKGCTWLLRTDATLEDWLRVVREALAWR